MNILILGGFGFVGKSVAEILNDSNHTVFTFSRKNGFDITNLELTKKRFSDIKPDVIINCAANVGSLHYVTEFAADVVYDNMQIILNLYQAVKDVCPNTIIINPIANCAYPGDSSIQIESEWWNGPVHKSVWSFANTKRMIVVVSECYAMQYNIKTINFIVPNSYGPGDSADPNKTHALNGMIIRMLQTKNKNQPEFEIWGTGKPIREWLYVKDFAKMLTNTVEIEEEQIYPVNVAQNKAYSIKEIAEMIKELIGYKGKLIFNTKYQDGAPMKKLDDKLFRSKFPEFTFTDIFEGIKETITYYKKILNIQ